jgi:hypothetical protein
MVLSLIGGVFMQPQRLYIKIPRDTWEQVKKLADAERRPPRYQVEHLVIQALQERRQQQNNCPRGGNTEAAAEAKELIVDKT